MHDGRKNRYSAQEREWYVKSFYDEFSGNAGIKIDGMANKSRGDYAYALIDVDTNVPEDVLAKLEQTDGVLKVRKVK